MRIKRAYCEKYSDKLIQKLNEKKIKFRVIGDGILVNKMISFSIYDDLEAMEEVIKCVKSKPIITKEYSNEELTNARLLCILPLQKKITITNLKEAFDFSCCYKNILGIEKAYHKKQVSYFKIQKLPSINTQTVFYAGDTGNSEIFVDQRVYNLVKDSNLKGVDFVPVKDRDGNFTDALFQMSTKQHIDIHNIKIDSEDKIRKCPICGQKKIVTDSEYQLRLLQDDFEISSDLYMTESVFGEGLSYPYYLISQRFYQLLLKNKLLKNVNLSPVDIL